MEKMLTSREIYNGRIISVTSDEVELENGRRTSREVVRHGGSVAMLVYDKSNDEFLFVKQFRYAVGEYLLEIPAGTLEKNEPVEDAVRRELAEEVKMRAGDIKLIGSFYPSPGFITEKIHIYLCTSLEKAEGVTDFDEEIEVVRIKRGEIWEMLSGNRIKDAKSVLALLLWQSLLQS